jgi:hypothetical protein
MGGPSKDSTVGKVVEKVGGLVKSEMIVKKGREMREEEGLGTE